MYALEKRHFSVELADGVISLVFAYGQTEAGTGASIGTEIYEHVAILKQSLLYPILFLRFS